MIDANNREQDTVRNCHTFPGNIGERIMSIVCSKTTDEALMEYAEPADAEKAGCHRFLPNNIGHIHGIATLAVEIPRLNRDRREKVCDINAMAWASHIYNCAAWCPVGAVRGGETSGLRRNMCATGSIC